jgi:hypothetical protein
MAEECKYGGRKIWRERVKIWRKRVNIACCEKGKPSFSGTVFGPKYRSPAIKR